MVQLAFLETAVLHGRQKILQPIVVAGIELVPENDGGDARPYCGVGEVLVVAGTLGASREQKHPIHTVKRGGQAWGIIKVSRDDLNGVRECGGVGVAGGGPHWCAVIE